MTRTETIPIVVASDPAGANGDPVRVSGNKLAFQVCAVPAALAQLEGSADAVTWADLHYDNIVGAYTLTVMNTLGAGYYEVFERPEYVRMVVAADAGGPRDFSAVLLVKKESN